MDIKNYINEKQIKHNKIREDIYEQLTSGNGKINSKYESYFKGHVNTPEVDKDVFKYEINPKTNKPYEYKTQESSKFVKVKDEVTGEEKIYKLEIDIDKFYNWLLDVDKNTKSKNADIKLKSIIGTNFYNNVECALRELISKQIKISDKTYSGFNWEINGELFPVQVVGDNIDKYIKVLQNIKEHSYNPFNSEKLVDDTKRLDEVSIISGKGC